jgi:hypothetical protein
MGLDIADWSFICTEECFIIRKKAVFYIAV